MARGEIPPELGAAFGVAAARQAGLSRSRLRGPDLERPFHGARAVVGAQLIADDADDAERAYPRTPGQRRIHARAAQYAPVMPAGSFYFGLTAAVLWNAPVPGQLLSFDADDRRGTEHPSSHADVLDVAVFWPQHAPRAKGIRGHAVRPGLAWTLDHPVSGWRIASPASTWVTLPAWVTHPYDLVAIADHFVHVHRPPHSRPHQVVSDPLATIAQLTAAVDAGRRRGIDDLRVALPRVRTGAASRTETWTRLTLVDAGLPEPVLDHDVLDAHGRFIATVDMAYPQWKIAIEYEGAHHSVGAQWEKDVDRLARLEMAGWRVIRVTRSMLFREPAIIVARVRAAIAERTR
ncbi:endonuclease domain-containing protein [Microbacterium luticocti]|uniref:endonuclease domain-containing protein n=1 Tax=Microbacterium luticocti TaxID=451764 RepID=UPI00048C6C65|nr:DUF559 domain-containing protein [Microbacterium luticocti]